MPTGRAQPTAQFYCVEEMLHARARSRLFVRIKKCIARLEKKRFDFFSFKIKDLKKFRFFGIRLTP